MKKHFDLQLYAEDAAGAATENTEGGAAASTAPENTTTDKEPATEGAGAKTYTDKEVDEIVQKKKAEWQRAQKRAVDEAAKLAQMSAQEQAEYALKKEQDEHEATKKELAELRQRETLAEMSKTARKMLADAGIAISEDLLSVLVTSEAESTKKAITDFVALFNTAVEGQVKARLRGDVPRAGSASSGNISEIDRRIKKYEV